MKGGKFMENCAEAVTIVFDKTGTLTDAAPSVKDVVTFNGRNPDEMLRLAACLEEHYPHSMANAVVSEAVRRSLEHEEKHSRVEYVVAHGIASSIDEKKVCIGSYHFVFEDEGCVIPEEEQERFDALPDEYSHLYLSVDGVLSAVILIEDPLKKEARGDPSTCTRQGLRGWSCSQGTVTGRPGRSLPEWEWTITALKSFRRIKQSSSGKNIMQDVR